MMADWKKEPGKLRELMQLIGACRDGVADQQQLTRLKELLETSLDARQAFVEVMHLENSLAYHLNDHAVQQEPESCSIPQRQVQEQRAPQQPTLAVREQSLSKARVAGYGWWGVAFVFLLSVTAAWQLGRSSGVYTANKAGQGEQAPLGHAGGTHEAIPIAAEIVAYSPDSRWGRMELAVMPGRTSLRPGQPVELQQGAAKIRFANGGIVVLQGPAFLKVETGGGGYLRSGKATLISSQGAGPLQLRTPTSNAIVNNAEVGIVVDEKDGAANLCALSGNVEVALLSDVGIELQRETITEGFAGRCQASRLEMLRIDVNTQSFLREVSETYIAYHNLRGFPGDQHHPPFEGALGMDFVVKDPIELLRLGVFDSNADGLKRTITAELWTRNEAGSAYRFNDDYGDKIVAKMVFTNTDPGELIESSRFKALPKPLRLKAGAYTIVTHGYGAEEPNGNEGNIYIRDVPLEVLDRKIREEFRVSRAHKSLDDGRGAILFVGSARFDPRVGVFPAVVDPGSVNRYRAGTFEFRRAPTKGIRPRVLGTNRSI